MNSFRKKFLAPKALDEDAGRREYILNVILFGSVLMTLALMGVVAFDVLFSNMPPRTMLSFGEFLLFPAFFIFLYALSRSGFSRIASYLLVAAYFLGNSYTAFRWGVAVPTAIAGYAFLIVMASILISARFAFFVAGAVAAVVLPLWIAEAQDPTFHDPSHFTNGDGVALVVLYGLITLIAWLSNREIEKSLRRARSSEAALREERDLLEVKVEERTRELRMAEMEKIDHLYRFAEFGQLASGLFHDLLNLLQATSLRIERETGGSELARKTLDETWNIKGEISRLREAFQKQLGRDEQKEIFSLRKSIESVCQFLNYQAKLKRIDLIFSSERADDFMYFGIPLKFHQVTMNLILNAVESFDGLSVEFDNKRVSVALSRNKNQIVFTVADNGPGIPADSRIKIFEPFFTTKKEGKQGTGIGLAMTKHIIEHDFGGTITVDSDNSRDRHGTSFTVIFPAKEED